MDKKTVYYRQYVIEWVEQCDCWRISREESQTSTIAYEDDLEEAKRRLNEYPDLYSGSEDGREVEICSVCMNEVELRWDINEDGFQAYCPVCGSRLMLCDACLHRHGEAHDDCWTFDGKCRFSRPAEWWKEE